MAAKRKLKSLRAIKNPNQMKVIRDADNMDRMYKYLAQLQKKQQKKKEEAKKK